MWDHSVPFQWKWPKHECLLRVLSVTICDFKDATFFKYISPDGSVFDS